VPAAIVGARSPQQVEQNAGAADLQLTDQDVAEIEGVNEPQPALVSAA
jgi:aryl-alcohol dehydrogenase-like predicted oxidoreductase